ncbi:hypothetical protein THAOC_21708, partial [Thalassiosira oceanica]
HRLQDEVAQPCAAGVHARRRPAGRRARRREGPEAHVAHGVRGGQGLHEAEDQGVRRREEDRVEGRDREAAGDTERGRRGPSRAGVRGELRSARGLPEGLTRR